MEKLSVGSIFTVEKQGARYSKSYCYAAGIKRQFCIVYVNIIFLKRQTCAYSL